MTTATVTDTRGSDGRAWFLPGFIALGAIWGSSFLLIKVGVGELHPVYVALGRVACGAVALMVLLLVLRDRLPRQPWLWLHLAVLGAVGVALPFTLFGYGELRIPSLLAGIWNATTPLVALPLAALLFRTERLSARKVTGILLGFAGVLVVLGVWQGVGGATLTGQLMCFAAASCYGIAIPYQKRFVAGYPASTLAITAAQLLAATALLAVIAPVVAGPPPAVTSLSPKVLASVATLGAIGTGVAFVIHLRNNRLVGASAASMVTYLIPVFAVLVGVVVLGETLTWFQPVGALVVLFGVAISQGVRLPGRSRSPVTTPDADAEPEGTTVHRAQQPADSPAP
ncbi:MAG TPA: DMT family transporter [Natronosporangium sp.]|nr:DMT family transporter [Natronosporangium sp.]